MRQYLDERHFGGGPAGNVDKGGGGEEEKRRKEETKEGEFVL
jgi:hypothetical protein